MKVSVLYFAGLREQLGQGAEEIELPPGVATLAGLRAHLISRGGAWQAALSDGRPVRVAVNQDMVPRDAMHDAQIKAGDEIAFFPPVTGG
ncbi:MAG: molybdopterin converting factor subunit 1 [Betaproteobacteria bacterium]|nr:molybdopterin converting factor subunit 1 [Betaproteobacteria bacterium]